MTRLVAALVWLALFAAPLRAWASERIADYQLTIQPDDAGEDATFVLRLVYDAHPAKISGFKFFGKAPIAQWHVRDDEGRPLKVEYGADYREERLDWRMPAPDPESGRQTVAVSLNQPLETSYGWGAKYARVPWAHLFRIPVSRMTVTWIAHGTIQARGCEPQGRTTTCHRVGAHPFEVAELPIAVVDETMGVVLSGLLLLGLLAIGGFWLGRIRRQLIEQTGIVPPLVVETPEGPADYRSAPRQPPEVIPPEPVLPDAERRRLRWLGLAAVSVLLFPVLSLGIMNGHSPWRMSYGLVGDLVLSGVALVLLLWLRRPGTMVLVMAGLLLLGLPAAIWLLPALGSLSAEVLVGIVIVGGFGGLVGLLVLLSKLGVIDWQWSSSSVVGGSSSGFGSFSSGSSCGSSCGSSGSSGGGGGCGSCGG